MEGLEDGVIEHLAIHCEGGKWCITGQVMYPTITVVCSLAFLILSVVVNEFIVWPQYNVLCS